MTPKPVAIIVPESREQLMDSVVCCRRGAWEIRVRCGGHSYEGSSYVSGDGSPFVVIDMMSLSRVSVDIGSEVAWVEGGATLGQTYYAISEASRVHGFSADNVLDALLVDADGRLLNRAEMGEEVFWAIRGGGGGVWGVVYAWKIRLLRVPETVTSFTVSRPGSKRDILKLVDMWQHVAPELDDEFYLSAFVGAGLPGTTTIGILEDYCKEMSWIESILYFGDLKNGSSVSSLNDRYLQNKNYFKAKSDYVKNPISRTGLKSAIKYRVEWEEEDNFKSREYIEWIRGFYDAMAPHVSSGPRAAYVNYMDFDLGVMELLNFSSAAACGDAVEMARTWGEKYFLKNYDRLVRAKTMIDPLNVFRHQQGIPPMSSDCVIAQS
ncbi:UNVERIFIED_CONTAM: Reticuline oxidase [Sesamum radiatum]|uniref:Reticuline oxidase n=1 Tax=Sesamum radiatum TaxID=300843 RepID=A0AAW2QJR7_SESRA